MKKIGCVLVAGASVLAVLGSGCQSKPKPLTVVEGERLLLQDQAQVTISRFEREANLRPFFERAVAYAVFPEVTRGGAGIGFSRGEGVVYEGDTLVGYADLKQATIGAQLGGQTFSELLFFEHEDVLRDFKRGNLELAAGLSAVVIDNGTVANNSFRDGVAVFTIDPSGLMLEASVGGQRFDYTPVYTRPE
ncbi:MAG: hypothetical protein AAGB34_10055 [Planctomycetota bacterium]